MQRIAFLGLVIYVFSLASLINQILEERLGIKPYSSTIAGPVMAIALIASGNLFRGLRTKSGILWLVMIGFMTAGLPFSVWRSDSLAQWLTYVVKIYPLFFFICAATVTLRQCEKLFYALIVAGVVVTMLTALLGGEEGGRLVMGTGTLANPNELALEVNLAACSFIYLVYRAKQPWSFIGLAGIAICCALAFRSGSRAGFLAILCTIVALFFTIRQAQTKIKMLVILAVIGVSAVLTAVANPIAFRRLTDIAFSDQATDKPDELYAASSEMARKELVARAVALTLTHPLLGVGLGEFPVAVDESARAQGHKSTWNGTHNTYLQVSSECGIPAALCFLAVIVIGLRTSHRLYRDFSQKPEGERIAGMALALFASLVALSVTLFFFHIAYSYYVPVLCGLTAALKSAAVAETAPAGR